MKNNVLSSPSFRVSCIRQGSRFELVARVEVSSTKIADSLARRLRKKSIPAFSFGIAKKSGKVVGGVEFYESVSQKARMVKHLSKVSHEFVAGDRNAKSILSK